MVRTHIERKELESRPRLTVAPGNGLERCSPMRRRWLRGHRPCVGTYGQLQFGRIYRTSMSELSVSVGLARECRAQVRSTSRGTSGEAGSHRTEEMSE